jgi:hypothetical protein
LTSQKFFKLIAVNCCRISFSCLAFGDLDRIEEELSFGIAAVRELRLKKKDAERKKLVRLREKTTVIARDFSQIELNFEAIGNKAMAILTWQCEEERDSTNGQNA